MKQEEEEEEEGEKRRFAYLPILADHINKITLLPQQLHTQRQTGVFLCPY